MDMQLTSGRTVALLPQAASATVSHHQQTVRPALYSTGLSLSALCLEDINLKVVAGLGWNVTGTMNEDKRRRAVVTLPKLSS